ncbi:MAG: hypothetical protein J6O18_04775 [Bacilli bacterium]|nr:hypothetical protein [Bacilli bacterium]
MDTYISVNRLVFGVHPLEEGRVNLIGGREREKIGLPFTFGKFRKRKFLAIDTDRPIFCSPDFDFVSSVRIGITAAHQKIYRDGKGFETSLNVIADGGAQFPARKQKLNNAQSQQSRSFSGSVLPINPQKRG